MQKKKKLGKTHRIISLYAVKAFGKNSTPIHDKSIEESWDPTDIPKHNNGCLQQVYKLQHQI